MLRLTHHIEIGKYKFSAVNNVKTKASIHEAARTATIKVPQSAVLKGGTGTKTKVELAQTIKRGDSVKISLGYDGQNLQEFNGYVKRINHKRPLEIECEDWFHLLREKTIQKSYTGKLSTALKDLVEGIGEISLDPDCHDLEVKNLVLADSLGNPITRSKALLKIKDTYRLAVYFTLDGKLYAGLKYTKRGGRVKYRLGWNTIEEKDLKYHLADDMALKVNAISIDKTGKRIQASIGAENGAIRTLYFYGITDKKELEKQAREEMERYVYDGYEGKVKCFLVPYAQPGMIAELQDPAYGERQGTYYIESVETEYGTKGGRRTVQIGIKL